MNLLHYFQEIYLDRQQSRELTHYQADMYESVTLMGWNETCSRFQKITVNHPKKNLSIYLLPGINFRFMPQIVKYPLILNAASFLEKLDFDLLHLNSHLNIQAQQITNRAKKLGKQVVLTVHSVIGYYDFIIDTAQRAYLRILVKTLFKKVDHLICETHSDMNELIAIGVPPGKMTVIHNGVYEEFFTPGPKAHEKTVIWHGRFIPQKGLPDLVRVAHLVIKSIPETSFKLLGWGPQKKLIMAAVDSSGLFSNFSFLGKIPWEDLPPTLASGHVYAMPSYREGMPYALLEAMACGTPPVAYSIPGASEVIDHGVDGYLVDIGDYRTMSKYIKKLLLDDELCKRMSESARKKIESHFSWQSIAKEYDDVYKSI